MFQSLHFHRVRIHNRGTSVPPLSSCAKVLYDHRRLTIILIMTVITVHFKILSNCEFAEILETVGDQCMMLQTPVVVNVPECLLIMS